MILVLGKHGQLAQALRKKLQPYAVFVARKDLDFSKPDSLHIQMQRIAEGHRLFAVINSMAFTAVDQAEDQPDTARLINAVLPQQIALFAKTKSIPMIHVSSDYVYGRDDDQWITEDSECDPKCVYGKTKLEGDRLVLNSHAAAVIIRTSWVWNQGGENFPNKIRNALVERAEKIARGEKIEPLKVVNDQWGRPTKAEDLAEAIIKVLGLRKKHTEMDGQIFHFTSKGRPLTWCGWALGIQKALGPKGTNIPHVTEVPILPVSSDEFPTKAKRPKNSRLSLDKISKYGFFEDDPTTMAPDQ